MPPRYEALLAFKAELAFIAPSVLPKAYVALLAVPAYDVVFNCTVPTLIDVELIEILEAVLPITKVEPFKNTLPATIWVLTELFPIEIIDAFPVIVKLSVTVKFLPTFKS